MNASDTQEKVVFSESLRAEMEKWVAKYPADQKQSAVLPILLLVQDENKGWLTQACMDAVADYLDMPHIAVYEVATFYSMLETSPIGEYKLSVCTNVSCMLRDCDKIVARLRERLGISFGETTPDGKFTLREVECLGACANAPVLQLGHRYYENLTPEKIDQLLDQLK